MALRLSLVAALAAAVCGVAIASNNAASESVASLAVVLAAATGLALFRATTHVAAVERPYPATRTPAERLLIGAVPTFVALNGVDAKGYFLTGSGVGKYVVLVPFALALAMAASSPRQPVAIGDVAFRLFAVLAVGGALVGALHYRSVSPALPLAATVFLGLSYMGIGRLSDNDCAWLLRYLEIAVYLYVLVHVAAALNLFDSGVNHSVGSPALFSNGSYTHEKLPLLFIALLLAMRRRPKWVVGGLAAILVVIYMHYPAGTYAAALLVYLVLLVVLKWRPRLIVALFALIVIAGAYAVTEISNTNADFGASYFARVGKTDNVSTRRALWSAAEKQITERPAFGSGFSGEATVTVTADNLPPRVPPHNDYLEVLLLGGVVGLGLFVAKVLATGRMLGRGLTQDAISRERRLLVEAVTVGIATFLAVFIFNPVLLKLSLAALFFSLLGLVPSLCAGTRSVDEGSHEGAPEGNV